MTSDDDRRDEKAPAGPYVRPALTLVGNLNDLLAGGASQNSDQGACVANGQDFDETC
jgi:hypothetical protein